MSPCVFSSIPIACQSSHDFHDTWYECRVFREHTKIPCLLLTVKNINMTERASNLSPFDTEQRSRKMFMGCLYTAQKEETVPKPVCFIF
jgi:hypothetical protein